MAVPGTSFTHPITRLEVDTSKPEGLSSGDLAKAHTRIARKAGYEKVSGNVFAPQSRLSKFNYFSARARNAHTSARAYYESGHLLTASILRENHRLKNNLVNENINAANGDPIWADFKNHPAVQRNFKRQDYINHRPHMLGPNNNKSRIATVFAQKAMNVWECTCAPTGFGSKMVRNFAFHGVSDSGLVNKAATIALSVVVGLGATTLIKAIRGAAGTSGYGFNPMQMVTGVLCAFAAVSATAGLVSWISGLFSQAALGKLTPTQEQRQFIEFEMNSTLNKINQLLLDSKDNLGKMRLLNKAMLAKFPTSKTIKTNVQDQTISLHPMLKGWIEALNTKASLAEVSPLKKAQTPEEKEKNLKTAKEFLGKYLQEEDGKVVKPQTKQELMRREKEFATLAGFVEHFDVEKDKLSPADKIENKMRAKQAKDKSSTSKELKDRPIQTLRASRMDGRAFLEGFAQRMNQTVLKGLSVSSNKILGKNCALSKKLEILSSPAYEAMKTARLNDPARAHLNKYDTEYISKHLHQYGPITRALMHASNLINDINYHYVLAINTQTSRLLTNIPVLIQTQVLGQHRSHIMCNAFGRFLGSSIVALVSFFGISALAGLTGGGAPADGFQNMSEVGSAKLSWLVTGTLMSLIGIPAFALGLLAKGAAMAEGWKGDIEKTVPRNIPSEKLVFV